VAQVGLEITEKKEDFDDTAKAFADDEVFLAELEKGCSTKESDWAERSKPRADKILAISDTEDRSQCLVHTESRQYEDFEALNIGNP